MLSTLLEPIFEMWTQKLRINAKSLGFRLFQMLRTFVVVAIGYVFDVAANFKDAMYTFGKIITDQSISRGWTEINNLGINLADYLSLSICTVFLLYVSLVQERNSGRSLRVMLDEKPFIVRYMLLLVGILYILVFGIYGPGYDPAEFAYMQF